MFNVIEHLFSTARGRLSVGLLIFTGAISIVIGVFAADAEWAFPVTVLLSLAFVVGVSTIYAPEGGRLRALALAAPAVGAVILGLTVLQDYLLALSGAAVGWIVAGLFLFRRQTPPEVMQAIKHMRKGRYPEALEQLDTIIKRDRENPEHYRLRAMVFRLDARLDRARRDYETMLKLIHNDPQADSIRAEAYDGLAEVHLQSGRFNEARTAATQAHELFPDNWVPLYNLGLICDRLEDAPAAIDHLTQALDRRIPDPRQKLLAHFYLARAHMRLNQEPEAAVHVAQMKTLWRGLEGLEKLIADEQSASLSAVIADDVAAARALMTGEAQVSTL